LTLLCVHMASQPYATSQPTSKPVVVAVGLCNGVAVLGCFATLAGGFLVLKGFGCPIPSQSPPPWPPAAAFYGFVCLMCIGPIQAWATHLLHTPVIPWAVGFVVRPGRLAVLCFWAAILCGLIRVLWTSYNPRDGTAPPVDDTNGKGGTVDRRRQLLFRKAFHILAVLMFTPVLVVDPLFLSFSFSVAFVFMGLCELVRLAALPPIGRTLTAFMTRFQDDRDPGPVLMTHIYLLLACAAPVWLDPSHCSAYAGILSIGVGDASASVVGIRYGRTRWPGTRKTIEGSLASLILQILFCQFLQTVGTQALTHISILGLIPALAMGVVLEAVTDQIDNLVVPLAVFAAMHAQ